MHKLNKKIFPPPEMTLEDIEQIYSNVSNMPDENGCLNWTEVLGNGYGIFSIKRGYKVHRLIKMLEDATWGKAIHHKCHNRKCQNNDHLEWTTFEQNMRFESGRKCKINHPDIPSLFKQYVHKKDQGSNKKGQIFTKCVMCSYKKSPVNRCDIETFNGLSKKEGYYLITPPL